MWVLIHVELEEEKRKIDFYCFFFFGNGKFYSQRKTHNSHSWERKEKFIKVNINKNVGDNAFKISMQKLKVRNDQLLMDLRLETSPGMKS